MRLMNMQPYEFVMNHDASDLKKLLEFRHRTFNQTDLYILLVF